MERYIQPFVQVIEKAMRDFCRTEVKAGQVFRVEKDEYASSWDISGIIGLSGGTTGAVAISMKDRTAFQIAKIITGSDHTRFDDEVIDAMKKIINTITENVKTCFDESLRMKISMPSIVKGKALSIVWPSEKTQVICTPLSIFGDQEICLSVAVNPAK